MRSGLTAVAVAAGVAAVVALPELLVAPGARLLVVAMLGLGVWVSVRRVGVVDLAAGGAVAAGAYLGGATVGLVELPAAVALPLGAAAGASVGALAGALTARVGRVLGSLATLGVGAGVVGGAASWTAAGGPAGFHAVPLLSVSGRAELALAAVAVVAIAGVLIRARHGPVLARAAVAVRTPHVAASSGRRPWADAAVGTALGGAVLGLGGALLAVVDGSIIPAAYGLHLTAVLVLAALVGGRAVLAGALGAVLLLGPGLVAPGSGVASVPILVGAVLGVGLLAWRPDGLVHRGPGTVSADRARPHTPAEGPPGGDGRAEPPPPAADPLRLVVDGAALPGGRTVSFVAGPSEVVALAGPNGSGKSTVLAYIGGQLDDGGAVRIGGGDGPGEVVAPRGVVRRARRGVARTWQRPPQVDPDDAARMATPGAPARAAATWAAGQLGAYATGPAGRDLVRLVARRPALALVDEPAAHLPADRVVPVLRGLAAAGATVVVAEHRVEVLEAADRVVDLVDAGDGGRS